MGPGRDRLLARGRRDSVPAARAPSDSERDRDHRAVRTVARPDPRLCRHRVPRPRGVLRPGRLCGRHPRQECDRRSARRLGRRGNCCGNPRIRHQLPRAARLRPDAADGDARRRARPWRTGQPDVVADGRRRRSAGHQHGADPRPVRVRHLRDSRLHLQPRGDVRAVRARAQDRRVALRPFTPLDPRQSPCAPVPSAFR